MTKKKKRLKRIYGISTILLALLILFIPQLTRAADPTDTGTTGNGITWKIEGNKLTLSGQGAIDDFGDNPTPWSQSTYINNVQEIEIEPGITSLGSSVFAFCKSLSRTMDKVTIPGSVETVTEFSGQGLRTKEIVFKDGVKKLSDSAFYDCVANIIRFPDSIEEIGKTSTGEIDQFRISGTPENYHITDVYGKSGTAAEEFANTINDRVLYGWISVDTANNKEYLRLYRNTGDHDYLRGNTLITFHPTEANPPTPAADKITVVDRRGADEVPVDIGSAKKFPIYDDTTSITATVNNLSENLYFFVRDKDSSDKLATNKLQSLVTLDSGGSMAWYDISLQNGSEKVSSDFGSCSITLPIPSSMDLTKGTVKAVTVKTDSTLEELTTMVENGCAKFSTTHFASLGTEFALVYTPNSSGGGEGGGGSFAYTTTPVDGRSDKTGTAGISATVTVQSANYYLHIKDSDGTNLKKLSIVSDKGKAVYYDITLTDAADDTGNPVTGFGACTITLPLPSDMTDTENGTVTVVTIKADGTKESLTATVVDVNGIKCAKFTTTHFSEYALVYEPKNAAPTETFTLTVKDMRKDTPNTECLSASVTKTLTENLFLYVRDSSSDGATTTRELENLIKKDKTINFGSDSKLAWYDITLKNGSGIDITDFGSATIVIPLPDGFDTTKGTVKAYTVKSTKELEELTSSIVEVKNSSGTAVKCAKITTTHFSEFALVYKSNSSSGSEASKDSDKSKDTDKGSGGTNKPADKGGRKNNANDMPKTGGEDVLRILFAMILFMFGVRELITSVYIKKEKNVLKS